MKIGSITDISTDSQGRVEAHVGQQRGPGPRHSGALWLLCCLQQLLLLLRLFLLLLLLGFHLNSRGMIGDHMAVTLAGTVGRRLGGRNVPFSQLCVF